MAILTHRLRSWVSDLPWLLARVGWAGSGRAVGLLTIWQAWERLDARRADLRHVRPDSILCYGFKTYAGPPTTMRDGTPLRPGDRLLALHLDNPTLLRRSTSRKWPPWSTLRLLDDDLDALACLVREGRFEGVIAIHGVSLLARESRWFGFDVRPLPRTWGWGLVHFYLVGLVAIHHPHGWQGALYLRKTRWPGELWMTIDELRQRTPRRVAP